MDPKESMQATQKPKSCISKNHKNPRYLMVFASRDLPEEPHEAQENSQKAPESLLDMKKKTAKIETKKCHKINHIWQLWQPKLTYEKRQKMGPLLTPPSPTSQGSK